MQDLVCWLPSLEDALFIFMIFILKWLSKGGNAIYMVVPDVLGLVLLTIIIYTYEAINKYYKTIYN